MGNRVAEGKLVVVYNNGMIAEECRSAGFIYFAGCNHQDELDHIFLLSFKTVAIEIKKQVGGSQSSPLITIYERMVFRIPNR